MAISFPLVAKGLAGLATVGAPICLAGVYRKEISSILFSKNELSEISKNIGISELPKKTDNYWQKTLNKEEFEKVKFFDQDGNKSTGLDSDGTVTMKIEETQENFFTKGFKFSFTPNKDTTVKKSDSDSNGQISLKQNKPLEFRLKENSGNYFLEEVWGTEEIKENLKLECDESTKDCSIMANQKINVKDGEDKKSEGVEFKEPSAGKKISFEKYKEGFPKGIRFFVKEDIELKKESETIDPGKLEKNNTSYEITKDSDKWYLSKVAKS